MSLNSSYSYYFGRVLFHTVLNVVLKNNFSLKIIIHLYSLTPKAIILNEEKVSSHCMLKKPINFQNK